MPVYMPPADRFELSYTIDQSGCWLWTGTLTAGGYGQIRSRDFGTMYAHRWAYEHFVGPIPAGLQIDHLCRVRRCVNPAHLEPVTARTNFLRGDGVLTSGKWQRATTHCPHGHPYSGENLYATYDGKRLCRICRKKTARLSYQRSRIDKPSMDN